VEERKKNIRLGNPSWNNNVLRKRQNILGGRKRR
jgi:hypothetical protein